MSEYTAARFVNPFTITEIFGEPIYTYSRAQALADGVLVELPPELVNEAGIRFPVAVTHAVYRDTIAMNSRATKALNDVTGRAWDVLWMLHNAAARATGETMFFTVHAVTPDGRGIKPRAVRLKAICGPNDDMTPCITVMLPEED